MRTLTIVAMLAAGAASLVAQAPQGAPPGGGRGRGPQTPPLLMTTTAFEDGGVIPDKYTQAAGPTAPSPALSWSQVPMGTQSFVLVMHDPEPVLNRGSKMDITHWVIWNIPGTSTGLPEGVPAGERGATGQFPTGTINYRVEQRLTEFADRTRALGTAPSKRPRRPPRRP